MLVHIRRGLVMTAVALALASAFSAATQAQEYDEFGYGLEEAYEDGYRENLYGGDYDEALFDFGGAGYEDDAAYADEGLFDVDGEEYEGDEEEDDAWLDEGWFNSYYEGDYEE